MILCPKYTCQGFTTMTNSCSHCQKLLNFCFASGEQGHGASQMGWVAVGMGHASFYVLMLMPKKLERSNWAGALSKLWNLDDPAIEDLWSKIAISAPQFTLSVTLAMIVKPGLLATKTNKFCISSYCRIDALSLQPRRVQARKSRAHSTTYCYRRGLPAWSSPSQCFHATFQQCHSHTHAYVTRRLPPHLVCQSSTYLLMVANYTVVCPMMVCLQIGITRPSRAWTKRRVFAMKPAMPQLSACGAAAT